MKGFYLGIDEFNTVILANLLAWKLKKSNPNLTLASVCHPEYQVLFGHFDRLIMFPEMNLGASPVEHLAANPLLRERNQLEAEKLMKENEIQILEYEDYSHYLKGEHIYKTILVNSIKYILEEGVMIKSSEQDRLLLNEFLRQSHINAKPIVVIGRNSTVHAYQNNLLSLQITKNLLLGRPVINATFPSPNMAFQRIFKNYHELPINLSKYGVTVALLEGARETIVIGNAGGIGVHMMTGGKLRLVGFMNWVNGENFSYEGLTLFKARKLAGLATSHTWFGEKPRIILALILSLLRIREHKGT